MLEAVCRLADIMSLPPPETMQEVGAASLTEFYELLCVTDDDGLQNRALKKRPSSENFIVPRTQPLARKVALLLDYMFGHLAVHFRGGLPAANGAPAVQFKKYLSEAQQKRYIQDGASSLPMTLVVLK